MCRVGICLCCSNVRKGALLIDSSTIDPSVAKEISIKAEDKGAVYMDAPVSGGKEQDVIAYQ